MALDHNKIAPPPTSITDDPDPECHELLHKIQHNEHTHISDRRSRPRYSIISQSIKLKTVNARTVLWYLSFFGFAINYMQRMNVNIAIVRMIRQSTTVAGNKMKDMPRQIVSACVNNSYDNLGSDESDENLFANIREIIKTGNASSGYNSGIAGGNGSSHSHTDSLFLRPERYLLNLFQIPYETNGFTWDEYVQGLILGSFFWLHWTLQVPGGAMARIYGTKIIFGMGNLLGCLLCGLMPMAAYLDYRFVIALRVVQGIICGGMWPSMHNMVAKWIPPNERSTFMSSYMGSSVGVCIFFPLFGYIMQVGTWEWVFHLCTITGVIWFICWQYFVYDSPAEHPRIDPVERAYIERSLDSTVDSTNKLATPWMEIFKSVTVWVNVITLVGSAWVFYMLMTQSPIYFAVILGWDMKMTGFLTGIPHLTRAMAAYGFSVFVDWALKTHKMTTNKVRIFSVFLSNAGAGIFTLILAYSGCNTFWTVTSFAVALTLTGTITSGPMASFVDISPNFGSIVFGFGVMLAILPGFITTFLVGWFTLNNQTIEQWRYVFLISAAIGIGTSILYLIFLDSSVQPWNYGPKKEIELGIVEEAKDEKKDENGTSEKNNKENNEVNENNS